MKPGERAPDEDLVTDFTRTQLKHFQEADPRCRGLQLPEGLMLRYVPFKSLYFYLRSSVKDGKILTRIFATDSPYDRQKTGIGEVATPMFEPWADVVHFQRLEELLHAWIDFVSENPAGGANFQSFPVDDPPQ